MAVWDYIGIKGELDHDFEKNLGIKSSYNSVLGDQISFIIGGGRFTNIFGTDVKLVIDWESVIEHGLASVGSKLSENIGKALKFGGQFALGTLFGIGGDTSMVLGNKNTFGYLGDDWTYSWSRHKHDASFQLSEDVNRESLSLATRAIYYLPFSLAILGNLSLTAAALYVKYKWKLQSSSQSKDLDKDVLKWVMILMPLLESRWLFLTKFFHDLSLSIVPLRAIEEINLSRFEKKTVLYQTIQDIEDQINLTQENIDRAIDQQRAQFAMGLHLPRYIEIYEASLRVPINTIKLERLRLEKYEKQKADLMKQIAEETEKSTKALESLGKFVPA